MGDYFLILCLLCQWGTSSSHTTSTLSMGDYLSPLQVHFYTLVLICDQSSSTLIRVNEILGIVHSSLGVPLMKEIIVSSPLVCKYNEARSYILHYCPCISVSSFCIVAILIYQLYIIFFNGIPIMKRVIRTHL